MKYKETRWKQDMGRAENVSWIDKECFPFAGSPVTADHTRTTLRSLNRVNHFVTTLTRAQDYFQIYFLQELTQIFNETH